MSEEPVGVPDGGLGIDSDAAANAAAPAGEPSQQEPAVGRPAGGELEEGQGEQIDLSALLQEERALKEKYLAGWQRAQADLENLKKQTAREKASERILITEALVRNMLPALDSLERAVKHARELGADEAITQGLDLVMRKFLEFLENEGVTPIPAAGEPYDPRRHEAILQVHTAGVEEGTVVQEIQRGYASRERVIRPALVAVACRAEAGPPTESEEGMAGEE
ncbi:MAG: nucleotide exchange factor GrpE [Bacillota bacterium]